MTGAEFFVGWTIAGLLTGLVMRAAYIGLVGMGSR